MYKPSYLEQASCKSEQYNAKYGDRPWKANGLFLFWNLVQLFKFNRQMRPKSDDVCRIAFLLKEGGIGDMLLSLNWLQNFHQFLDGAFAFDLYVKHKGGRCAIVQTLCREQSFVKQVLPTSQLKRDYDLYTEIVRIPNILYYNESKIRTLCPKLEQWCQVVDKFHRENPVAYRDNTHGIYIGMKFASLQGRNRLQQGDIDSLIQVESNFQPKIFADPQETLAKFSLEKKRFITMQRGVGGRDRNVSIKLWPMQHYENLVQLIKKQRPELCIVQVGTQINLPINGVDIDLREKTAFEDAMVLMQQSRCHIDSECGLVHLRHFLKGGPSVVLFGPTEKAFYGHEENINLQSDACVGGCEWITPIYTSKCPRGLDENVCLSQLAPEVVLEKVVQVVGSD